MRRCCWRSRPPAATSMRAGTPQLVMARVKDAINLDPSHATDGHVAQRLAPEVMEGWWCSGPARSTWPARSRRAWTVEPRRNALDVQAAPERALFRRHAGRRGGGEIQLRSLAAAKRSAITARSRTPTGSRMFGGFPTIRAIRASWRTCSSIADAVTFVLAHPSGPFLRNIAMPSFAIGSPAAIARDPKAFEQKPVGSGPVRAARMGARRSHHARRESGTTTARAPSRRSRPSSSATSPIKRRACSRSKRASIADADRLRGPTTRRCSRAQGDLDRAISPRTTSPTWR